MAHPAMVVAKVAASVAADKRARKAVGTIIAVLVAMIVVPFLLMGTFLKEAAAVDYRDDSITEALSMRMSDSDRSAAAYLDRVMIALKDEYDLQGVSCDFVKVQLFYLCLAYGKEKSSDTFYEDFVACFLLGGDYAIISGIESLLGVSFSAADKRMLIRLAAEAEKTQHLPPGSIHEHIGKLTAADDTVYTDGPWGEPLHRADYMLLITSGYGRRIDPFTGKIADHTGIDFGVSIGTPVYPLKPGKVIIVERGGSGYGNYVVISHGNGFATLYGHLSTINVSEGQTVGVNTVIARSGNSGRSTAPHLHLEVVKDGKPENPKRYLP